jgi:hypothetical protein
LISRKTYSELDEQKHFLVSALSIALFFLFVYYFLPGQNEPKQKDNFSNIEKDWGKSRLAENKFLPKLYKTFCSASTQSVIFVSSFFVPAAVPKVQSFIVCKCHRYFRHFASGLHDPCAIS